MWASEPINYMYPEVVHSIHCMPEEEAFVPGTTNKGQQELKAFCTVLQT